MLKRSAKICAVLAVLAATGAIAPAAEAIECRGAFQLVQGREISTPYCRDNRLAAVARSYGLKVSDGEIRNNPNTKRSICRLIGRDIRVSATCDETDGNARRF